MTRTVLLWLTLWSVLGVHGALADRVILENGNVLEGRAQRRGGEVLVYSALGTLAVSAESVRRIERDAPREAELLRLLNRARTVPELLRVAEQCRAAGAGTLARRALERVLELEPDHAFARASLGYRRVDEEWTLEPVAAAAPSQRLSRAERQLVAALLAASTPQAPAVRQPQVVVVPPLAWPPVGFLGAPPTPSSPSPAPAPPSVTPPTRQQTPVLRARRATRGRFVRSP